ncbi:hypothetical protein B0T10DRAFT_464587 [Thelonectria olida]|uniref:Uncharacterized protein n=1 Tax=Thelonectria olida TaxID=1576542 RepID=A0A9P8VVJ6_9HYPO|nr:hypothetical protein B0T10DRAFT_464587 [Thelonectria olida]
MSSLSGGNAIVGGIPTVPLDVPINAVLVVLYLAGSAYNITTFIRNKRRGHKFIMSLMLNGLCVIRILTCSMRIAWAANPTKSSIITAAQALNTAGIIIIYIINLVLGQRILRARQPAIGWNPVLGLLFKVFYALIVGALIMGIVALVLLVTTTNPKILPACHYIQMAAVTLLLVMTVLPLVLLAITYLLPPSPHRDEFGQSRMAHKVIVLITSTCLAMTYAGFKAGTAWDARPQGHPAWFDSKAAFYVFGFTLEILILCLFAFTRIDRRFHIPDNCKGPGDYSGEAGYMMQGSADKERETPDVSSE